MIKKINLFIDIVLWLGVLAAAVYFGVVTYDPFPLRMTVLAALWLAGYWTLRSRSALKEVTIEHEQTLKETREISFQRERLEAFIELSHDGIIILDKFNNVLRINEAVTAITGYTKTETLGHSCSNIFKVEKYKEVGLCFGLAFLTQSTPSYYEEVRLITKDGRPIELGVRCTSAKKHPGHRGAHLILIRDLTKIREAEIMEHDFVSMTSHQLFTPLSIIRGHLSMLSDGDVGKVNEKQHYFINQSLEATIRMIHLVSELLSISRLEERKITFNFTPTDLNTILMPIIAEMKHVASAKKITIHYTHTEKSLPLLNMDGEKMAQVFQNLIDNAIKYSPQESTIAVKIEARPKDVLLSISDHGIGIPALDIPKLFQRFYRSENAIKEDTRGTGLGLYIARVITERHSGKIWLESTEKKGSTFYLSLPK